jgi:hypothetical protein
MKITIIFTTVLLSFLINKNSYSQNSEPTQPDYEKKVYIDEQGNYYIQKSLPVYLYFSTSTEGEKHRLKSKKTAKYADPMYLDSEGYNSIRSPSCVDPKTRKTVSPLQDIIYEVYADGLTPHTHIRFSGAPKYSNKGNVYYGKGLNVSLQPKDAVSGVEKTHYSINGAAWADYNSALTVSDDGEKSFYYYSNDKVGNAEKTRNKKFIVDVSSPKSTFEIVGIVYDGNIISPSTRFKLSSTDNLSGVRTTFFSYDTRDKNVYNSPASTNFLKDGDHILNYYSVDNVKNGEPQNTFNFYMDKIAPLVTTTIEGDQYIGKYKYISTRTKIKMVATDNKAGVESITYRVDNKELVTYTSQFNISERRGLHPIAYNGTDNVKNKSSRKTLTVYMDPTAPTTWIKYNSPQFFTRDTLFITKNTNISLGSRDNESGVKIIEYSIDGSAFKEYSKFTVPTEGFHKITFKSTDRVNNEELVKESHCLVDNTPPVIYHNFSIQPIGTKKKGGNDLSVYPNYTRIYLGATDEKVGTQRIQYSFDGKVFVDYSSAHTLDISELSRLKKNKFYKITVKATDKLGNESQEVINFFVGKE